jgi:hypothetical protein
MNPSSERHFRVLAISDAISSLDDRGRRELESIGIAVRNTDEYLEEAAV